MFRELCILCATQERRAPILADERLECEIVDPDLPCSSDGVKGALKRIDRFPHMLIIHGRDKSPDALWIVVAKRRQKLGFPDSFKRRSETEKFRKCVMRP